MPCPVQVYESKERDDGVAWLAALPECADVSARDVAKAFIGGVGAAIVSLGGLVITRDLKNHNRAR